MKNKNLVVVYLITLLNAITVSIVIPILYVYARTFGLDDIGVALLLAIFPLAQFFAGPFIGGLSDRYGRKPLLIISVLGTALSNVLAAVSGTALILFIARLLDGVTGGNVSVVKAVISDEVEPQNRAKAFGLIGAMFGLGFLIGPVISLMTQSISLSAVYWVSAVLAFITTIITAVFLDETHRFEEKKGNRFLAKNNYFMDTLSAIFKPDIGIFLLVELVMASGFSMLMFAYQPYILNVLKGDQSDITKIMVIIGVTFFIVQGFISRKVYPKFGLARTILFSVFGQMVFIFIMGFITTLPFYTLAIVLFASFNSLYRPILSSIISIKSKTNIQGKNLGYDAAYYGLGQFIGPILGGGILTATKSYSSPYFLSGIIILATLFYIFRNIKRFEV